MSVECHKDNFLCLASVNFHLTCSRHETLVSDPGSASVVNRCHVQRILYVLTSSMVCVCVSNKQSTAYQLDFHIMQGTCLPAATVVCKVSHKAYQQS